MRRLLLLLLTAWMTATLAGPAWAHTRLVSSTPSQGASAPAPAEVALVFSDPVQAGLSAVSVTGTDGGEHASGSPAAGGDGASVSQALRAPLPPGTYRVAYRVIAADGHPVTDSFEITSTAPTSAPAPAPEASATATPASPATPAPPAPTATPATTGALQPIADERDDAGLPVLPLVVGGLLLAGVAGLLARRLAGPAPGG